MADQEVVIVGKDGTEHVFPPGFDPKKAAAIVAGQSGPAPTTSPQGMGAQALDQVTRMGKQVGKNIIQPFVHPLDTMIAIGQLPGHLLQAQGGEYEKAKAAYQAGDRGKAALHALAYLAPVVGPMLDEYATRTSAGQGPEVAGDITSMMLPAAVAKVPAAIRVGGKIASTPESQALEFAASRGVPVDAATATGNSALRQMQKVAENTTIAGAKIGKSGSEAVSKGLSDLGRTISSEAGRGQPTTMLAAGEEATGTMGATIKRLQGEANSAYDQIRQAEKQGNVIGVNIKDAKTQLQPVYDQLVRESKLAQPQGATAKALIALDRLMQAPDVAPLSVADGALGEIKAALRKSGESDPWSKGTSVLSQTVKALDKQVMDTAKIAKLDTALTEGRAATIAKYDVADTLESMGTEPAATVNKILAQKDRAVMQLRQIGKHAPEAVAEMGKAYLDDLLTSATAEGGFGKTDAMFSKWQSLGTATKKELFADVLKKNPDYLHNLDQFFLAAKSLQKSMNPSGSGYAMGAGLHMGAAMGGQFLNSLLVELGGGGVAAALRSPRIARVLAQGIRVPAKTPAASATYLATLAKAFQAEGLPVPAVATTQKDKQ